MERGPVQRDVPKYAINECKAYANLLVPVVFVISKRVINFAVTSAPRPDSLIKVRYLWTYGGPAKEPLTEHRLGNRRERSRSSRANLLTNISSSFHMYLPPHHQPLSKCQKYLMSYRSIALKHPLVGFCIKHSRCMYASQYRCRQAMLSIWRDPFHALSSQREPKLSPQ